MAIPEKRDPGVAELVRVQDFRSLTTSATFLIAIIEQ